MQTERTFTRWNLRAEKKPKRKSVKWVCSSPEIRWRGRPFWQTKEKKKNLRHRKWAEKNNLFEPLFFINQFISSPLWVVQLDLNERSKRKRLNFDFHLFLQGENENIKIQLCQQMKSNEMCAELRRTNRKSQGVVRVIRLIKKRREKIIEKTNTTRRRRQEIS